MCTLPSLPLRRPVRAAHVLGEDPPRLDTARDVDAHVAVERRADVVRAERGRHAHRARLVAAARVEGARDLPLLVEDVPALLDPARDQHVAVDAEQVLAVEPRLADLAQRADRLGFFAIAIRSTPVVGPVPRRTLTTVPARSTGLLASGLSRVVRSVLLGARHAHEASRVARYSRRMARKRSWLQEERRRTLGDWVALCLGCGHVQRYFERPRGPSFRRVSPVRPAAAPPLPGVQRQDRLRFRNRVRGVRSAARDRTSASVPDPQARPLGLAARGSRASS